VNYYDIKAIWKTNLISDSNYVLQVGYRRRRAPSRQHPMAPEPIVEAGQKVCERRFDYRGR